MTVYAHVTAGTVDQIGRPPLLDQAAGRWWDLRTLDPANLAACGWLPITETPRPPDTAAETFEATYTITGATVTQTWSARAWTADELAARAQAAARLDGIEDRLARIEAKLWPPQPDTTPSTSVSTLAAYGGVWPAGALLLDGGKTWRNVSGVPLTTAPTSFPGDPDKWTHLFVLAPAATQPPTAPAVAAWSATATYAVGDKVTRGGITYRCLVAHGAAYAGTWGPPLASVWAVV